MLSIRARRRMDTWRDTVAIESILFRHGHALPDSPLLGRFGIQCSPEASRALLVHLRARRDAVDGHEEQLLWLDLAKEMLDVIEDGDEHLVFGHAKGRRIGVFVRTVMNDAIHVELRRTSVGIHQKRPMLGSLHIGSRTLVSGSRQSAGRWPGTVRSSIGRTWEHPLQRIRTRRCLSRGYGIARSA